MKNDYVTIYKNLQLSALEAVLTNSFAHFERKVRRWFSKTFHTPLHTVDKLSWDYVLTHYYESIFENMSHNEALEIAMREYLPDFISEFNKLDKEFDKALVKEQLETIRRKEEKEKRQSLNKNEENSKPKPKSVNLTFDDEE